MAIDSRPLLGIFSFEDRSYFYRLVGLIPRARILSANTHPKTASELTLMAHKAGARAVVTTSLDLLSSLLKATPDYRDTTDTKKLSLDDFAGSILDSPAVGPINGVEVLILNPLDHLVRVSHAPFIFAHYLDKLLFPEKFPELPKFSWTLLDSVQDCKEFHALMDTALLCAIDIETFHDDPLRLIDCCSWTVILPDYTTRTVVLPIREVWQWDWLRLFNQHPCPKVMQNGLYDSVYFCRWAAPVTNWIGDTLVLFHAWYSELPRRLDFIASFSIRRIRYWKNDGKTGDIMDHYRYNGLDTWATLHAFVYLLSKAPVYAKTNYLINFPKVFPSLACALVGISVDASRLEKARNEAEAQCQKELEEIQFILDEPNFNPNSPVQISNLFNLLKCGNLPTTGAADMLKARAMSSFNDVVLGKIVGYKKKMKLLGTYYVPTKFWLGRCFYALNPAATDTGRLASKESAFWCGLQIQNIPRGDAVKQFLKADPGYRLAEVDKKASESRCVGYLSGETKLINLVESEKDFHSWNASAFFGIPYDQIWDIPKNKAKDKALRDLAKRVNHGANYSMGPTVLAETMGPKAVVQAKQLLKLPASWGIKQVCEHLLSTFTQAYPKIQADWYNDVTKTIRISGKLVSGLGWTRHFFGKPWENKPDRNAAIAHGPQNLSVAMLNEEFYQMWRATAYGSYFKPEKIKPFYSWIRGDVSVKLVTPKLISSNIRLLAQIHDSLLFQYKDSVDEAALMGEVLELMNTPVEITAPDGITRTLLIPSDAAYGDAIYWSDIK